MPSTPLATWQDAEARWRPLTVPEQAAANTRLADASALVRSYRADVDEHLADDNYRATVVRVVAEAAVRVLRNPAGVKQESIGARSYTLDASVAGGALYLTEHEQAALDLVPGRQQLGGAFTIRPGYVADWPPAGVPAPGLDPIRRPIW